MFGLVGFTGNVKSDQALVTLQNMAEALDCESETKVVKYIDTNINIGGVFHKTTVNGSQLLWNEDNTICIMMIGELYDYQDWKQKLINNGHHLETNTDAEFALHLYQELGEKFIHELNGSFIITIYDTSCKKLLIINDRFGLYPLYYAVRNGSLIFATALRAILAQSSSDYSVDNLAIAQLLAFDYVLDDKTLINEIKLLPPASTLIYHDGSIDVCEYWELEFQDSYLSWKDDELIEGFGYFARQAVERQAAHDDQTSGILLSGGLDSRLIAAYLASFNLTGSSSNKLYSFTFGISGCDDARNARKVAKILQTEHQFYELQPDYLIDCAQEGVRLTDGMFNCIHMHSFANIDKQANLARVIYKGYMGDALLGGHLNLIHWAALDEDQFSRAEFKRTSDLFSPQELENLLDPPLKNSIFEALFDTFRNTLSKSRSTLPANRQNHFDLRQRQRRFILNGVRLVRSKAVVRTPFCDRDLVDFILKLPPGIRYNRRLLEGSLIKDFPKLAQIPITQTGLPLMHCMNDLQIRVIQFIRGHLHTSGLIQNPRTPTRPYADYDKWFRGVLLEWSRETLLSEQTKQRGYFNSDYVRKILSEHVAGKNHSRKLGILIALELWHRQMID